MSRLKVLPHETLCPEGREIEATPGVSICDTLLANGIEIEHACEKSCAFGALVMHDADKPPPTTKMPDLDNGFQTPIEGLYLIGQAAGIPQVLLSKAEEKLFTRLGEIHHLGLETGSRPVVAVAGCVAQQEGPAILERSKAVDVVIGTQSIKRLPMLVDQAVARRDVAPPRADRHHQALFNLDPLQDVSFPLGVATVIAASVAAGEGLRLWSGLDLAGLSTWPATTSGAICVRACMPSWGFNVSVR